MIAVDTNILVYATRAEAPHHLKAQRLLTDLAEGDVPWALPWPCIYEFVKVVTHPRVFNEPTPLNEAVEIVEALLDSPSVVALGNGPTHRSHLRIMVLGGSATGNLAHDAHIAALAIEHGVDEILTADRDLARFPHLRVRNPFAA
jgi:toxin-antitoxin system PIN domain toxin